MALHVKSTSSGNPANHFVSVRHASATGGQRRLIRLGPAANDNHSSRTRWVAWLITALTIAAVIALASMI
jgi:hypothetical protein